MNLKKHLAIVFPLCLSMSIGLISSCDWDGTEEVVTPTSKFKISGKVVDSRTNKAIEGANVKIYFNPDHYSDIKNKSLITTINTKSNGSFSFSKEYSDMREALFLIMEVNASGYKQFLENVQLTQGKTTSLEISLDSDKPANEESVIPANGVSISPTTVCLGSNVAQAAIKLYNHKSEDLQYTITDYPSFITVSPAASVVEANGVQTIIFGYTKKFLQQHRQGLPYQHRQQLIPCNNKLFYRQDYGRRRGR